MKTPLSSRIPRFTLAALLLAALMASSAAAQQQSVDAGIEPGDIVAVVDDSAVLKITTNLVARVTKGEMLPAILTEEEWIWTSVAIDGRQKSGWIHRSQVRLLEKGSGSAPTPDVVFVPTPFDVVQKMLEMAEVNENDLLYDLGCGDGRIVVEAAKRFGCRAVGVDIDPQRVVESRKNVKRNGVDDLVQIKQQDVFKLDLRPATVVTLYLLPELNEKLIPQLQQLEPGSRIVAHNYRIPGIEYEKVVTVASEEDGDPHHVYRYTLPLVARPSSATPGDD